MQDVYQSPEDIQRIQQYFSPKNATEKVRVNVAEGVPVPIYILGSSTDSARLAAKMGLPYAFASHFSSGALLDALAIYHREFQPSEFLREPYTIACVNVIAAETDEKAERLSTSYIKMILGVLTGQMDYVQPPTELTDELRELVRNPALQQMMKYAFIGSKETVKTGLKKFLEDTRVSELMIASNAYDPADRLTSYRMVAGIMQEM